MTDFRALCAELVAWVDKASAHYYQSPELLIRARAALAEADGPAVQSREPASVVEQPSDEAVECWAEDQGFVRGYAEHPCGFWIDTGDIGKIARAVLPRWGSAPPQPIPVSERLPELRGQFERILCVARSSGGPSVGNIQLAGRLINAVRGWLPAHDLPLPKEVE